MRTYEISGIVVFADSAIQAIRQAVEDADEISYLTADPEGKYSQYCVNDELITVFNLKD